MIIMTGIMLQNDQEEDWAAGNTRSHLEVHALLRTLEYGVQRLDSVVKNAMAARSGR